MKSSLIRARDAVLDAVAPRKWMLRKVNQDGTISICSLHRTRADAVLAIPVDGVRYFVTREDQWSGQRTAWAASSLDTTTPNSEESK